MSCCYNFIIVAVMLGTVLSSGLPLIPIIPILPTISSSPLELLANNVELERQARIADKAQIDREAYAIYQNEIARTNDLNRRIQAEKILDKDTRALALKQIIEAEEAEKILQIDKMKLVLKHKN